MGCVYKLTSPSGKHYIGVTMKCLESRFKQHVKDHKRHDYALYQAMRKYGPDSFSKEVLATSDDQSYLLRLEIEFVKHFDALKPGGYNLNAGGKGELLRSKETVEKQSLSAKMRFSNPSERSKQSQRVSAAWSDPAFRERMTNIRRLTGSTLSFKEKARQNIANQRLDPSFNLSVKEASRNRFSKLWSDPVYRESQIAALHSKASRQKASESLRRKYGIVKRIGTRIGMKNSKEHNSKIGAANREAWRRKMEAMRTTQ